RPPRPRRFPCTTLFRSNAEAAAVAFKVHLDAKLSLLAAYGPQCCTRVVHHTWIIGCAAALRQAFDPIGIQRYGIPRTQHQAQDGDRKSTRLNSSHVKIS